MKRAHSFGAPVRYGFESFESANKRIVNVLRCSRTISLGASIFTNITRRMNISRSPFCASSTAIAQSPTRTRHGCVCMSRTASAAWRQTFGRESIVRSEPAGPCEWVSSEEMNASSIIMRKVHRGVNARKRREDWEQRGVWEQRKATARTERR